MAYPDEYNPFFHVEQGFWCQKDVFSQGFLGSTSRIYIEFGGTYTPAVASDIGKTVKDDGVYSGTLVGYWNSETDYLHLPTSVDPSDPTAPTWWLVGYYPIASGSTMTIPSGTGGGVTNAGWATQPGGGAVMVGHGLTAVDDPPKMVLSSSALGFDTFWFVDIEGNLANIKVKDIECDTINGVAPTSITEKGSDTTDGSGDCTVTFDEEFDDVPLVFLQGRDAAAKGIVLDVVSKSTTQFVVKARKVTGITSQAKSAGTPAGTNTQVSGGTPSGTVGNESSHTHALNQQTSGADCTTYPATCFICPLTSLSCVYADHSHTIQTPTLAGSSHSHSFTGDALAVHSHIFVGQALAAHTHTVDAPVLAANFDWMAIPA